MCTQALGHSVLLLYWGEQIPPNSIWWFRWPQYIVEPIRAALQCPANMHPSTGPICFTLILRCANSPKVCLRVPLATKQFWANSGGTVMPGKCAPNHWPTLSRFGRALQYCPDRLTTPHQYRMAVYFMDPCGPNYAKIDHNDQRGPKWCTWHNMASCMLSYSE